MKILHCLSNFFPGKVAGTEVYVFGLCKALQLLGIEVKVIKPSFNKDPIDYEYNGLRVIQYLEDSLPSADLQTGIKAPKGIINFNKLLLKERPDAIHFHEMAGSNGITIYHVVVAKKLRIPIFTTFHLTGNVCMQNTFLFKNKYACNGVINEYKCSACMLHNKGLRFGIPEAISFFGKQFKRKISLGGPGKLFNYPLYIKNHSSRLDTVNESSEKMFVLSNWYKSLLVANGMDKNKIVVLPTAIPISYSETHGKKSKIASEKVRLVYAGRITRIKGLHILLEAMSNLKRKNWELDIYGAVSEDEYFDLCKKLSANNSMIHWKGILPHDRVIFTLAEYDALIFPSIVQETMGLIMLEAFGAGLPVIASAIWSASEQIDDGINGMLFQTGNIRALQNVLEKVLADPTSLAKMSANVRPAVYMNEVALASITIYKEALQSKY